MENTDVYRLLDEAWARVGPVVLADERELRARLARRRAVAEARPPRAFCAAVRANDTRITPVNAVTDFPSAVEEGYESAHRVMVDTRLMKHLTALVSISAPGVDMHKASEILGVYPSAIYRMIRDHRLGVRYIPLLRGQKEFPVPLVHTRGDFDPCGRGTRQLGAERLWDGLLGRISETIPEGLAFDVERVPWREEGRNRRFRGWNWLCPGCGRESRNLYLPLDAPDFAVMMGIAIPEDERALCVERPRALGCKKCYGVFGFSASTKAELARVWGHTVRYLSSGMLYGKEVKRPAWLKVGSAKMRHFLERDEDYFAHEVERRQREEFGVRMDSSPMWVNGKLNPIFDEPLPDISIDPLTNKTIRRDGSPDGLWRPRRKGARKAESRK